MRPTMKTLTTIAVLAFLLSAAAWGQSQPQQPPSQPLGDVARSVRKNKPQSDTTTRYFDNDNLPSNTQLSVVGPAPSKDNASGDDAKAKMAEADRQRAVADIQGKIDQQKSKIAALTHELDLDQREYRLRAAAFYGDAGNRLRDSAQWSKDDAQYKSDMDSKQKAIADAQQQLNELQEQARKAGVKEKESDSDQSKK